MRNLPRAGARVLVVGLGKAGSYTVAALVGRDDAVVVAGVDPQRERAVALPEGARVYASLADLPDVVDAELAVVATPTPTHVEVCRELLRRDSAVRRILCEKPFSPEPTELEELCGEADRRGVRLEVLFHYAFAPEVLDAAARRETLLAAHGPVVSAICRFEEPYGDVLEQRAEALVSSWVDSGINALSVLARLVEPLELVGSSARGEDAEATVRFRSAARLGEATIRTSWTQPRETKRTTLTFADGAQLELDHLAGHDGARPQPARYRAMLDAHLRDAGALSRATTIHLHRLLAQGPVPARTRSGR